MGRAGSPTIVTLALAGAMVLAGCSGTSPVEPASSPAAVSSTTPAGTEPTERTEPTPSDSLPLTTPAPVALTADGIGDLAWGKADAADVEALLGPADSTATFPCAPETVELSYGGLSVFLMDATLYSWQTDPRLAVPTTVSFPDGVAPGAPMSDALGLPGAGELSEMGPGFDLYVMAVRRVGAQDAVVYVVADRDPSSPIVEIAARNLLTCS